MQNKSKQLWRRAYVCYAAALYLTALPVLSAQAQSTPKATPTHAHEYAQLRDFALPFKDFTFKTLDDTSVNLRAATQGKQLVLVHYFATWCHSSNYDVQVVNELYRKYKDQGFIVIAICEYSKADDVRDFMAQHKPEYTVLIESTRTKERANTTHYAYRQMLEDTRSWGTPLNIFLLPADFSATGEFLTSRARVVPGELIKTDIEEFIRQQLKLP